MMAIITPRAIPVNTFGSGKNSSPTYEFYNPSALARQLAFAQLPIRLCYADVVKPRETITTGLEWIRIAQLQPNANTTNINLSAWIPAFFITQMYKQWWEEWKEHLFSTSALTYSGMIDPNYKDPDNTVSHRPISQFLCYFDSISNLLILIYFLIFRQVNNPAPIVSRSGKPIELLPSGPITLIGHNAPSLAVLMHRNVRFKKTTTKRAKASPPVAAATLAQAFKVKLSNFLLSALILPHTHIIFSGYIGCNISFIDNLSFSKIPLVFL